MLMKRSIRHSKTHVHQRSTVFERARRIVSCHHPDYLARPIALRRYRAHMRTCAVPDPETYLDLSILSRIITIIIESRPCASTIVLEICKAREGERARNGRETGKLQRAAQWIPYFIALSRTFPSSEGNNRAAGSGRLKDPT